MQTKAMHDRAERLVRNEVYVCLSSLVSALASGYGAVNFKGDNGLTELCEQAFDLCAPRLKLEDSLDTWMQLCEAHAVDPYEWEIFEHWAVSSQLAADLRELGERVDMDFAGMCVWGRTTTGQGIAQDGAIRDVLALHDKRVKEITADPAKAVRKMWNEQPA